MNIPRQVLGGGPDEIHRLRLCSLEVDPKLFPMILESETCIKLMNLRSRISARGDEFVASAALRLCNYGVYDLGAQTRATRRFIDVHVFQKAEGRLVQAVPHQKEVSTRHLFSVSINGEAYALGFCRCLFDVHCALYASMLRHSSTSSMTRQGRAASAAFVSVSPAATIKAFHKVQARPRAQVPASSGSIARKASRLSPLKSVQAMDKSHAGSPTPSIP